jgi:hypothetical protein
LQQFGALRAGVCPSGQAAQRSVEQSTFAASVAVPIDPDDVPDEPLAAELSVVAVPLDPPIVPSVPVCPVPVPVQAASERRTAIRIAINHDLFMRPPLSATLVFKAA